MSTRRDFQTPLTRPVGTIDALLDELRARVPGFPHDFVQRIDEPLRELFTHYQLQGVRLACSVLVPDMPRQALDAAATGRDLLAMLGNALESERVQPAAIKRGTYASTNVRLRPITEQDISALYLSALEPSSAHRWRFRGATPAPDAFRRSLFGEGVLAQFVVVRADEETRALGLVSAYGADLTSGHSYVAFQRVRNAHKSGSDGLMIEGLLIFIQYLFDHFNLYKLYFELPEYNRFLIAGAPAEVLKREGQLIEHLHFGDRRWDLDIYAIYKSDWDPIASLFRGEWEHERHDTDNGKARHLEGDTLA